MTIDKIFQPFFTTIPIAIGTTGQGTGLGLSLSYDIVKAPGRVPVATCLPYLRFGFAGKPAGKVGMKVETPPDGRAGKEGEGTDFNFVLPL